MRLHLTDSQAAVRELLPALGAENALLTAGTADRCNTMTIGCGVCKPARSTCGRSGTLISLWRIRRISPSPSSPRT